MRRCVLPVCLVMPAASGELGRGQRAAAHQRRQHFRACVVADQRRRRDHARSIGHCSMLLEPIGNGRQPILLALATAGATMADHLFHPLRDRSVPARRLPRIRAALGQDHPARRRPPGRLLPAARRHEQRRLGIDCIRQPGGLRALPRAPASADPEGTRELRASRKSNASSCARNARSSQREGTIGSRPRLPVRMTESAMIAVIFEGIAREDRKDALPGRGGTAASAAGEHRRLPVDRAIREPDDAGQDSVAIVLAR